MAKTPNRETVYIDAEDDITAVIDKVKQAKAKIVALVLPKRSATFQSAVNLKLLKKSATSAKKSVVLISSDSVVMSLASLANIHVAKTLQSKPVIPESNIQTTNDTELNDTKSDEELAETEQEDTVEMKNEPETKPEEKKSSKKNNKFKKPSIKIPNFERFRLRLIIIVVLILLLGGGGVWASSALPKATITVKTDTAIISKDLTFTAETDASEADIENSILPAEFKEIKKTSSNKIKTTGERDDGTKATGTLTLTNCIDDDQPHTIPAGTGFTTEEGITFLLDKTVTLEEAVYDDGKCATKFGKELKFSKDVTATALSGGEKYNVEAQSYEAPAAYQTVDGSITAYGSDMEGGTTKIVKIVSQSDLDAAKQAILDKLEPEVKEELEKQFASEQAFPLKSTFKSGDAEVTSEPKVDEEAEEVNITVQITYSQVGVSRSALTQLVENAVKDDIDSERQLIQNTGIDNANLNVITSDNTSTKIDLSTTVVAGPHLDEDGVKQTAIGKKSAEAKEIIESWPGIIDVQVELSPFWVVRIPSAERVTVVFVTDNAE